MGLLLERTRQPRLTESVAEEAIRRADQGTGPVLVTRVLPLSTPPDPLTFLQRFSAELGRGVYWRQPHGAAGFAGAGAALELMAHGPDRFADLKRAVRAVRTNLVATGPRLPIPIIGGFSFDASVPPSPAWHGFPAALFRVPQVLLQSKGNETHLRLTTTAEATDTVDSVVERLGDLEQAILSWQDASRSPGEAPQITHRRSIPARATWERSVSEAIERIGRREFDKVVLAREERLFAATAFDPIDVLSRLRTQDEVATHFALQSGPSWFLGATPERLVRLHEGRVDVTCLAGSIARGANTHEDRDLAQALLASVKDREEHEIVVRSTMAALRGVCSSVTRQTGTPRVVMAGSVQHLQTPVQALIGSSGTVLDLVERLHPTPAVGGHPQAAALEAIRELERFDRGWYAAPFGWTDLDGSGEFVVAIRSALLSGTTASLFAGCGIVAGSLPESEFAETAIKLRPMLNALGTS